MINWCQSDFFKQEVNTMEVDTEKLVESIAKQMAFAFMRGFERGKNEEKGLGTELTAEQEADIKFYGENVWPAWESAAKIAISFEQ